MMPIRMFLKMHPNFIRNLTAVYENFKENYRKSANNGQNGMLSELPNRFTLPGPDRSQN